ncbi:MAG: 50S ribosomal protein L18e [archaeon]
MNNKHEQITELIKDLKTTSIVNNVKIWKRIAVDLEKPTRNSRVVNIFKIDKYARPNEILVIPGKVLGTGELTKKVQVAAYNFSDSAFQKIKANGEALSIRELMEKNPKGKKLRILG